MQTLSWTRLWGTGFSPPLRGLALVASELIHGLAVPVVAVDLPSGWDADSMEQVVEGAFRADAVVTFTAPKRAHVFGHLASSRKFGAAFGPVVVAEIGSPEDAIRSEGGLSWTGTSKSRGGVVARKLTGIRANLGMCWWWGGALGRLGRLR